MPYFKQVWKRIYFRAVNHRAVYGIMYASETITPAAPETGKEDSHEKGICQRF
jgi:hypothetical protein